MALEFLIIHDGTVLRNGTVLEPAILWAILYDNGHLKRNATITKKKKNNLRSAFEFFSAGACSAFQGVLKPPAVDSELHFNPFSEEELEL